MTGTSFKIQINAPVQKVWEVLADIGDIYRWSPGVMLSHSTSHNREGLNASRHCTLYPSGEVDERVTRWEDGRSYDIEIQAFKGMPMKRSALTVTVVAKSGGTEVTLNNSVEMKFGILGRLMLWMGRRKFENGMLQMLNGLKHYIETGEQVTHRTRLQWVAVPA